METTTEQPSPSSSSPSPSPNKHYTCQAFNFYLFKDPHGGPKQDITYSLSAVEFLRTFSFDFGKVMSHGVTFLSEEEGLFFCFVVLCCLFVCLFFNV